MTKLDDFKYFFCTLSICDNITPFYERLLRPINYLLEDILGPSPEPLSASGTSIPPALDVVDIS